MQNPALHAHAAPACTVNAPTSDTARTLLATVREIRAHVAEPFWYIHAAYRPPQGQACSFAWQRGHIYDHAIATVLYEACCEAPLATVTKAWPLTTCAAQHLDQRQLQGSSRCTSLDAGDPTLPAFKTTPDLTGLLP